MPIKTSINFEKLVVNPENYRFDPVDNQSEAIDLMMEEKGEEIFNLAKHILDKGLDRGRDTRVCRLKDGTYLVLDGNRRVTAIKCLHDPLLIKNARLRSRFQSLLKSGKKPVNTINCTVYKNEEDAAEWIRLDHTGKNNGVGQDSWGSAEQDRFDYKFGGKLSPATQVFDLYTKKTGKSLKTKDIKISTVNRILSNPEARSYLGIDVNKGIVSQVAKEEDVLSRLGALFTKIIKDDVPVSEVYKVPQAIKFMKDIFGDKPKLLSAGTILPKGMAKLPAYSRKALPKSLSRTHLIPKECILRIKSAKINNIYRELRDDLILDNTPSATPNAVGVLFRVFLEVSLDYYSEKVCGKPFSSDDTIAAKINFVTEYLEDNKIAKATQLSAVRIVSNAKSKDILHIQRFHEYVHSATIQPDPSSLKAKWDNLQDFFQILWGDLEKRKK